MGIGWPSNGTQAVTDARSYEKRVPNDAFGRSELAGYAETIHSVAIAKEHFAHIDAEEGSAAGVDFRSAAKV